MSENRIEGRHHTTTVTGLGDLHQHQQHHQAVAGDRGSHLPSPSHPRTQSLSIPHRPPPNHLHYHPVITHRPLPPNLPSTSIPVKPPGIGSKRLVVRSFSTTCSPGILDQAPSSYSNSCQASGTDSSSVMRAFSGGRTAAGGNTGSSDSAASTSLRTRQPIGGGYRHGTLVMVGPKGITTTAAAAAAAVNNTFSVDNNTSGGSSHRRRKSASFESFTASCDDAWDSNLEDCVGSFEELATSKSSQQQPQRQDSSNKIQESGPVRSDKPKLKENLSKSSSCQGYSISNQVPHSSIATTDDHHHQDHDRSKGEAVHHHHQQLQNNISNQVSLSSSSSGSFVTSSVETKASIDCHQQQHHSPVSGTAKSIPGSASCLRPAVNTSATQRNIPVPQEDPKLVKFRKLVFEDDVTDMNQLRSMSWAGIPFSVRPVTWKLLLGYVPVVKSRRIQVLESKRRDYEQLVVNYYNTMPTNDEMWRQIHIDIPRMQPLISIFQQEAVQKMFERILYIWSVRHPASGYVQGMNDLVTPFFVTYLSEYIAGKSLTDVESFQVSTLPSDVLKGVEADSFWSFSKLLDSIQDNYTFAQPGIQRLVNLLSRVMSRVDAQLHDHLTKNSVQYLQFAFRWMNNLLIRELPLRCIVRLWDTYLSEGAVSTGSPVSVSSIKSSGQAGNPETTELQEGDGGGQSNQHQTIPYDPNPWSVANGTPFSCSFHLFVCAAFLRFWSKNLMREQDFQGLILLLQNLPTFHWTENEIKLMVADAYQLKYTFTPNHLNS